jgi:CheY-like chemotaxis protein
MVCKEPSARDDRSTLAILDWMMPEMDGFDVRRRVRAQLPLANMYAARHRRESRGDVVMSLDAGADDYIIKPFDPESCGRASPSAFACWVCSRLASASPSWRCVNVKQLHGMLPICSTQRIRGDDQCWQVEGCIADHSEAQFSHLPGVLRNRLRRARRDDPQSRPEPQSEIEVGNLVVGNPRTNLPITADALRGCCVAATCSTIAGERGRHRMSGRRPSTAPR